MKVEELFTIGLDFRNEGRIETAMDIWRKGEALDSRFAPIHLEMHNVYRGQGNLIKAKESLIKFINCPLTGATIDALPAIRQQIAEIDKQLNPQPPK